ncbi:MAG: protein phosphatase 2C domain-containing protein [Longimicrobiales bacterium]|nr:protein phosphatase 2C domain-containing protein [Longimicrobiales bacterium]
MTLTFAGHTDVGRVRAQNEDALLQLPLRGVAAVADGMGGHAAGDVASRIAVDVIDDRTRDLGSDSGRALADAVREAHEAILRAARADAELQGMGTTLTVLRVDEDEGCVIAHVGDSRAYRWRGDELEQLTRDQTWVQQQVEAGTLTEERARDHPFASILTGALGVEDQDLEIEMLEPDCRAGDTFLLCSDGLIARLTDAELLSVLQDHAGDLDAAARALVDAANEAGGPDNITVALVRIED